MPDILIRGVDPLVVEKLKSLAEARGTSLQTEAKRALESSARYTREEFLEVTRRWQERTTGRIHGDSTDLIRETRDAE